MANDLMELGYYLDGQYKKNNVAAEQIINSDGISMEAHTKDSVAHVTQTDRNRWDGKTQGYTFDTKAEMDAWIAVTANKNKLKPGDNLYIRATDTPDYWWDGTNALVLEAEKVALVDYYTKSETYNKTEVDSKLGAYRTESQVNAQIDAKAKVYSCVIRNESEIPANMANGGLIFKIVSGS